MTIDTTTVVTGCLTFALGLVLQTLLDLHIAQFLVKYFWWLPVRNIFRTKPPRLGGVWEEYWDAETDSFPDQRDRHGHVMLRQLGSYCYGEFFSKQITYCIFGQIQGAYIIGRWYDRADELGYFGSFQLTIVDSSNLHGRWFGHSKTRPGIRHGEWTWKRITA
jgi:hypothetical protein